MKFGFQKWFAFPVVPIGALAQGTFSNLGFESATIIEKPNGVDAHSALPSWAVYYLDSSIAVNTIFHNDIALGSWMVSIHDSSSPAVPPIAGRYSVFLQSGRQLAERGGSAIAQTGSIPIDARSLLFSATRASGLEVLFAGQKLPLFGSQMQQTTPITLAVDLSGLAGQSGELRFNAPFGAGGMIDDIRFSPNVVPEPKTSPCF